MAVIPSGQTPTQLVVNTGLSPSAVQLLVQDVVAQSADPAGAAAAVAASVAATYATKAEAASPRLGAYNQPPASLLLEAAPTSVTTFSGDSFSGAASTSLNRRVGNLGEAHAWTVVTGTWQLDGAGAVAPTTNTDGLLATTTFPAANRYVCSVRVDTTYRGTLNTSSNQPALVFRWVDANNFWYFNPVPYSARFTLYQVKAGTHNLMAQAPTPAGIGDGAAITLRVDLLGRDITCLVNGTELFTFSSVDVGPNSNTVGFRQGITNSYATPAKFSNFRVTTYAGPKFNIPRIDAGPSTQILGLGAPGSWEDTDINNPNVFWDPTNQRWTLYYSGYDGSDPVGQGLGLAYADTLAGPWTKDPRNPIVAGSPTNVENGSIVYTAGRWLRAGSVGSGEGFFTSSDLTSWTPLTVTGLPLSNLYDPFLRVTQNGLLEVWYGAGYPNATIYKATSVDGGVNWTVPVAVLTKPPYFTGTTMRGNGEPSVYVPPGKEGVEAIVFLDGQEIDGKGYLVAAFTVDGGATWRWRNLVGGSGTGFDAYQKFDSYPIYAEGAFHLFHAGAAVSGNILNLGITIGHLSVQWTPNPSTVSTAAAPYSLTVPGAPAPDTTLPVVLDPATVSGLVARFRADSITGIADGATFGTWADLSTGGNPITSFPSAAPVYIAAGVNGSPSARFAATPGGTYAGDGGQSLLDPTLPDQTFVAVIKASSPSTTRTIRASNGNGGITFRLNGADELEFVNTGVAVLATGTSTVGSNPAVVSGSFSASTGAYRFAINGTVAGSGTAGAVSLAAPGSRYSTWGVDQGSGEPFIGDIAELLVYNRVLTPTELALIDTYASDRYGITVSDHS